MMYFSKISLDLLALASGVALLILIKNQNKIKNFWPSLAAWLIIILSSLSILCSGFYAFKFWNYDYFKMHKRMMMPKKMMENYQDKKNMNKMYQDMSDEE